MADVCGKKAPWAGGGDFGAGFSRLETDESEQGSGVSAAESLPLVMSRLPMQIVDAVERAVQKSRIGMAEIEEIRLRRSALSSLTARGRNIPLELKVDKKTLAECVLAFCEGSFYAHVDTICEGYIAFNEGIRVGVCGNYTKNGEISVYDISSLNIRISHIIRNLAEPVLSECMKNGRVASTLICSPPGIGKTTLLRDIAACLGEKYGKRVAIIDTRKEIYIHEMFTNTLCDVVSGCPRGKGIELATRTLSPEVIICDELGGADETSTILEAQNTGVPIIATAHAGSLEELLSRPNINMLIKNKIFDNIVGLSREIDKNYSSWKLKFSFFKVDDVTFEGRGDG